MKGNAKQVFQLACCHNLILSLPETSALFDRSFLSENFDPSDPNAMEGQKVILKCPVQLTIVSNHSCKRYSKFKLQTYL